MPVSTGQASFMCCRQDSIVMEPARKLLRSVEIDNGTFTLTLHREDFSTLYPGMIRYELAVTSGGQTLDMFRTNTYRVLRARVPCCRNRCAHEGGRMGARAPRQS